MEPYCFWTRSVPPWFGDWRRSLPKCHHPQNQRRIHQNAWKEFWTGNNRWKSWFVGIFDGLCCLSLVTTSEFFHGRWCVRWVTTTISQWLDLFLLLACGKNSPEFFQIRRPKIEVYVFYPKIQRYIGDSMLKNSFIAKSGTSKFHCNHVEKNLDHCFAYEQDWHPKMLVDEQLQNCDFPATPDKACFGFQKKKINGKRSVCAKEKSQKHFPNLSENFTATTLGVAKPFATFPLDFGSFHKWENVDASFLMLLKTNFFGCVCFFPELFMCTCARGVL